MDCSEDMREPWERAEEEELAGFSSVAAEHEFWCPDDGHTAGNDEPTAVNDEPCAREVKLPLAPATPAGAEQQAETPGSSSKKRSCEGAERPTAAATPGALIPAAEPPKRIRYRAKTPAPPEVGPTLVLTLPEDYTEEFVSKKVWYGMTVSASYNYVYEKIRGFYVRAVHEKRLRTEEERDAWQNMDAKQKQKDCDLVSTK